MVGLVIIVVAIVIMNLLTTSGPAPREILYSDFLAAAKQGQVLSVAIAGNRIDGKRIDGSEFTTFAPDDPTMIATLRRANVNISVRDDSGTPWYVSIFLHWGPFILIIAIWIFIMRRMQSGGNRLFSLGKSRARRVDEKARRYTFADVAGVEEAKEELVEIIEFLKDSAKFRRLGGKIPKGVLMIGPPGT
ncbi:MAG: ATP-dependent metallopeptidase FtsH/Yme1/Tma family protein, partial [bacterium]